MELQIRKNDDYLHICMCLLAFFAAYLILLQAHRI